MRKKKKIVKISKKVLTTVKNSGIMKIRRSRRSVFKKAKRSEPNPGSEISEKIFLKKVKKSVDKRAEIW